MRKEAKLMEMRREMGVAHYYAWRISCKCHVKQKDLVYFGDGKWHKNLLDKALWWLYEAVGSLVWVLADICATDKFKGLRDALIGLTAILATMIVMSACAGLDTHKQYPTVLQVTDVQEAEDGMYEITFERTTGYRYTLVQEDGDYWPGEIYAATMDDNGTPEAIADDQILEVRYVRVDMFREVD